MPSHRIEQLQRFYDEDPHDPFNIYALALEYMKIDPLRTSMLFEKLLTEHQEYLPTYYHAAKFFQERGLIEKATELFERGISLASKLNDTKTVRELKSAYDEMMFE